MAVKELIHFDFIFFFFTVKFWLYLLIGKFAEVFPEHMIIHSDRLVSMYVNILKEEVSEENTLILNRETFIVSDEVLSVL